MYSPMKFRFDWFTTTEIEEWLLPSSSCMGAIPETSSILISLLLSEVKRASGSRPIEGNICLIPSYWNRYL